MCGERHFRAVYPMNEGPTWMSTKKMLGRMGLAKHCIREEEARCSGCEPSAATLAGYRWGCTKRAGRIRWHHDQLYFLNAWGHDLNAGSCCRWHQEASRDFCVSQIFSCRLRARVCQVTIFIRPGRGSGMSKVGSSCTPIAPWLRRGVLHVRERMLRSSAEAEFHLVGGLWPSIYGLRVMAVTSWISLFGLL